MIGSLPAATSGHVLHNDRRIARHMFAQDVDDRARAHIRRAGRRPAEHDIDRFVSEKRRLRENQLNAESEEKDKRGGQNGFHGVHSHSENQWRHSLLLQSEGIVHL